MVSTFSENVGTFSKEVADARFLQLERLKNILPILLYDKSKNVYSEVFRINVESFIKENSSITESDFQEILTNCLNQLQTSEDLLNRIEIVKSVFSKAFYLRMFSEKASERRITRVQSNNFIMVDGIEWSNNNTKGTLDSNTDSIEIVNKRLDFVGTFSYNNMKLSYIDENGRLWIGKHTTENLEAIKKNGYEYSGFWVPFSNGETPTDPEVLEKFNEIFSINLKEEIYRILSVKQFTREDIVTLKNLYQRGDEEIKSIIGDKIFSLIESNLDLMEVVPLEDYRNFDIPDFKPFIARQDVKPDIFTKFLVPLILPEKNPAEVYKQTLAFNKIFKYESYEEPAPILLKFIEEENVNEIVTLVEVLGDFFEKGDLRNYNIALEQLKKLTAFDLTELKSDFEKIRELSPTFKYTIGKNKYEVYYDLKLENNPIDFLGNHRHHPFFYLLMYYEGKSLDEFENIFYELLKVVGENFKSDLVFYFMIGFTTTIVSGVGRDYNITTKEIPRIEAVKIIPKISKLSKLLIDYPLKPDQIKYISLDYLKLCTSIDTNCLDEALIFCDNSQSNDDIEFKIHEMVYGDAILKYIVENYEIALPSKVSISDLNYFRFSFMTSSIFKYPPGWYKHDYANTIQKVKNQWGYALQGINKIQNPVLKDLASLYIIMGLTDEEVGNIELTELVVNQIQNVKLKELAVLEIQLENERATLQQTTGWKRAQRILRRNSFVIANTSGIREIDMSDYEAFKVSDAGSEEIKKTFGVVINMPFINLVDVIRSGKYVQKRELPATGEGGPIGGNDVSLRTVFEMCTQMYAKGTDKDPFPPYGSATSGGKETTNRADARGYGSVYLKLKKDTIKDRTTFCYGDSLRQKLGPNSLTGWDEAQMLLAFNWFNVSSKEFMHQYVEAQIHGGVRLQDIAEIGIVINPQNGEGVTLALAEEIVNKIRRIYPNAPVIKIYIGEN